MRLRFGQRSGRAARAGARDDRPSSSARRRRARRLADRGPLVRRSASRLVQLLAEVVRVARARSSRGCGGSVGYASSSPPRSRRGPSGARRAAAARGGGLRRDHPERLGEDRRHDRGVGEREQVDEVAVLERAGEEDVRRPARCLELRAVVAEADDDGARVDARAAPRAARGRPCCGSASRSRRRSAGRRRGTRASRSALPSSGSRSSRCPGSADRAAPRRASAASASSRGRGTPLVDVDAGRDLVDARRRGRTPPRAPARMCAEPTNDGRGALAAPRCPTRRAPAFPRIEYSSSEPCALTRVARAARGADRRRRAGRGCAKTRSAGRCSRSAAAFASTQRVELGARAVLHELRPRSPRSGRARTPAAARRRPAARSRRRRGRSAPDRGSWREDGDVVPGRGSTRARAGACRRSSRCRRAGSRARDRTSRVTRPTGDVPVYVR